MSACAIFARAKNQIKRSPFMRINTMHKLCETPVRDLTPEQCRKLLGHAHPEPPSPLRVKAYLYKSVDDPRLYFEARECARIERWIEHESEDPSTARQAFNDIVRQLYEKMCVEHVVAVGKLFPKMVTRHTYHPPDWRIGEPGRIETKLGHTLLLQSVVDVNHLCWITDVRVTHLTDNKKK